VNVDAQGRYTLLLGAMTRDGIPPDVFVAGTSRWVGVQWVGHAETARTLLTSTPYALNAASADTFAGRPITDFLLSPAGQTRTSSGTGPAPDPRSMSIATATAGTAGRIAMFVNSTDLGDSAMSESGGRVGLGTAAPLDVFHAQFTDTNGAMTGFAVQNLGNTAKSYSGMLFYDQTGALGQFQGFNNATHEYRINNIAAGGSINFMLGSQSKFLIASNGNIGIRKGSPTATLDVSGTLAVTNDQPATPLQVFSAYTGNIDNDPTTAPATASFFGATSVGVTGPGGPPAGSQGVVTYGGNGGVFSFTGGTGGIGLHAIGGNGGSGLNVGGPGGTAILALGGDSGVGSSNHGGDGGSGITAFGGAAGLDRTGGFGLYAVGGSAGQGVAGAGAFIAAGTGGTTAAVLYGDVFLQNTGNLTINGNAFKPGGGSWSTLSDGRTKKSIEPISDPLAKLLQLRGVTFEYVAPGAFGERPGMHIGMIAQEVERVFPGWVDTGSDGYKRLTFRGFEAVAVEAVRELDTTSKEAMARIADLERQNAELRRMIGELSEAVKTLQQKSPPPSLRR